MPGAAVRNEPVSAGESVELRLLGEVELWTASQVLDVGASRPQAVLAALAVDAGRPVAIETLIDRVWDDSPPVEVRNVLYSHLSRIRRLLRQAAALSGGTPVRVERRHAGYVLAIDPDLVDLHRFRRLVEQGADRQRCDATRVAALAEALGLWRGLPMAGLPGKWAGQVRESWDRRRLDAVVQWARLELRLGRPAAVIATLPDLAAEYPLIEPFETLLMQALYAAGRGAEALDRYATIRQRLADELGTDPGPGLRAMHQAILHDELPPPDPMVAPTRSQASVATPKTVTTRLQPSVSAVSQHRRAPSRLTRRRVVLAALVAALPITAIGSVNLFQDNDDPPSALPSTESVRALFAAARELAQAGRLKDAFEITVDAVQLYDELIKQNPDRHAPPLAPAIMQTLGHVGVDFSVAESALRDWLANPVYTPYAAISQQLLLQGWRLRQPVYLDVIVWNYEQSPGMTSPRDVVEVRTDVLRAAVLAASNVRYGTQVTDFARLLKR